RRAILRLVMVGVALVLAALAWSPSFPISKKLWTGSFVLLTTGINLTLLAALATVLESRPANPVTRFFQIFGRNPLVIYLFSELFVVTLQQVKVAPGVDLFQWLGVNVFQAAAPGAFGALLGALAYMLICWLLGYFMDRRGIVVAL
ncbi:MAG TPA: DUF5009 domain-containing protein, partial [Phenylobacterium sp.]|nr:DUF5009 domain-containing protein [Phenylobacterium sp.]